MRQTKAPADNLRFGATAAGRAYLNGGGGMPPLRQAAGLCAIGRECGRESREKPERYTSNENALRKRVDKGVEN
jgi:hypothetical protein